MPTALITGANRGIGRQTAEELVGRGYRVYLGTRQREANGKNVAELGPEAFWLTLDVADSKSVRLAASRFGKSESALDVLINNAGIYADEGISICDVSRELLMETFQINTFGAIAVAQAFLPYLRQARQGRIINVSSGYGELDGLSPRVPGYCLSKLTLNGVTIMLADELRRDRIAVNSVCPGWVRTDMGGEGATRSVEEGAAGVVWLATKAAPELTGKFFRDGEEID